MTGRETTCGSDDMQHHLIDRDFPGTKALAHQGHLPLTPPATAERSRHNTDSSNASALIRLLEARKSQNQADHATTWLQVPVDQESYETNREKISQIFRRFDYDPNRGLLQLRMPSTIHDFFASTLGHDLMAQLKELGNKDGQAAAFASKIRLAAGSKVILAEGDSESFKDIQRSPDMQLRHIHAEYPGVVIEVSYSQDGKKLRKLAQDYILYSNGDIKAVIGIDISYRSKEAFVSLWRPKITYVEDEDIKDLAPDEVISYEMFRSPDGRACNDEKNLNLTLGDFATNALSAVDYESIPIHVSFKNLFDILEESDELGRAEGANVAERRAKSQGAMRKRRLSSSSA